MKNIIWLTEWFPSSLNPYTGDGIERRAKAASIYNNIFIIYVKKKPGLPFGTIETEERVYNEHCKAFIFYYPSIRRFSAFLDACLSNFYFFRLHHKAMRQLKARYGKPDGIQVNVVMKNGLVALYHRWLFGIRYIVVEGWSLFLPESQPGFQDKDWIFRVLTKKVLKRAALLVTVSDYLGKMIKQNIADVGYKVVPSVVDGTIFFPGNARNATGLFRFIHISDLEYPKNAEQILIGFKQVLLLGYDVELIIHSPFNKELNKQIAALGIADRIILKEEGSQSFLADSIRSSDALILFSRYETFGNVVIEAQACGIPAITSDYPTFRETIGNGFNGIMAKGKNAKDLADAMITCIKNRNLFDHRKISEKALSAYSFEFIGNLLDEIYKKCF